MKITQHLHFEDNEVRLEDADGNEISSKKYKTPALAKAAFTEQMQAMNLDPEVRIEFVDYVPAFPPQRIAVWEKE